jgi:hypothetical protein
MLEEISHREASECKVDGGESAAPAEHKADGGDDDDDADALAMFPSVPTHVPELLAQRALTPPLHEEPPLELPAVPRAVAVAEEEKAEDLRSHSRSSSVAGMVRRRARGDVRALSPSTTATHHGDAACRVAGRADAAGERLRGCQRRRASVAAQRLGCRHVRDHRPQANGRGCVVAAAVAVANTTQL